MAFPGVQSRIVDGAGRDCPAGVAGELWLKGENLFSRYWRRPAETREAFTADGWFKTGDIAVRDDAGFHGLVDRKKDMFISGGENVYPAEIEAALAGHPLIAECAVVGAPDARWGEVLTGGADWQTIRDDGVTLLQARYTIRMDDGATIGVINTGVRRAAPEVVARLTAGEVVDPSLYYFRATPVFEVGSGPYRWLTESVFVSLGERLPDLVRLKVYRLD